MSGKQKHHFKHLTTVSAVCLFHRSPASKKQKSWKVKKKKGMLYLTIGSDRN